MMLPRTLTLLLVLFACTCVRAQQETPVTSSITHATVFLDGAQVSREAKAAIPAGRATLVFTGLTPDMDPKSIQVKAGNEALTVLSVSQRLNFNEPPAEDPAADKLFARIEWLDARKNLLNTHYQIAREEQEMLQMNRVVASPQTGLNAEDLIAAVNFHRERITATKMLQLSIQDSLAQLKKERLLIQEQLAEIGQSRKTKATAEVVVITQTDLALSSEVMLTYLVPNARWVPHYDIRVADVSRPIDLRYRAKVSQSTGEDWTNVRLKLSTGDPSANATAPVLPTWRISQGSRPPVYRPGSQPAVSFGYSRVQGRVLDRSGEQLIGASVLVQGMAIGAVTNIDGIFELEVPADAQYLVISYTGYETNTVPVSQATGRDIYLEEGAALLEEIVVTDYAEIDDQLSGRAAGMRAKKSMAPARDQAVASAPVPVNVQQQATTVNFDIELPYTIPADGKPRDVEIKQHDLPADYRHCAVPKFSPDAFLTARVTNWEQYNLLPGEAQLFFEGTYLGLTQLNVGSTSDTLQISLGRDPNVVIERKETDDYRSKNFFGGKTSQSRGYTIGVRNKKDQPIHLTIRDQMPVSGDENIDIKTEYDTNLRLEEATGFLTWKLELAPRAEAKTSFGYTVKYPNQYRVVLE